MAIIKISGVQIYLYYFSEVLFKVNHYYPNAGVIISFLFSRYTPKKKKEKKKQEEEEKEGRTEKRK